MATKRTRSSPSKDSKRRRARRPSEEELADALLLWDRLEGAVEFLRKAPETSRHIAYRARFAYWLARDAELALEEFASWKKGARDDLTGWALDDKNALPDARLALAVPLILEAASNPGDEAKRKEANEVLELVSTRALPLPARANRAVFKALRGTSEDGKGPQNGKGPQAAAIAAVALRAGVSAVTVRRAMRGAREAAARRKNA